jgi:hypothetical protein
MDETPVKFYQPLLAFTTLLLYLPLYYYAYQPLY